MLDKLLLGERMLSFGQPRKVLVTDWPLQSPSLSELSTPFAESLLVAAPIVLFFRCELALMVIARLTRGERFRDGKHRTRSLSIGNAFVHSISSFLLHVKADFCVLFVAPKGENAGCTGFAGGIIGGGTGFSSAGIFCVLCATSASKREQSFSAVAIHFRSMNSIGSNHEVCSSCQRI